MIKKLLFVVLVVLLASSVYAAKFDTQIKNKLENEDYVDVIIKLKEARSFSVDISGPKRTHKNVMAAKISKKEFEELKNNPNVENIFQNRKFHIVLDQSVPQINVDDVWGKNLKGSESVCVLDTGVDYNHPALKNRINGQHCYCQFAGLDCCPNGLDEDTDAMDDNDHGTHIAGIVASNKSYLGIAPFANITAVKIGNSNGDIDGFDLYLGIDWCIQNKDVYNISVITMSLSDNGNYDSSSNCDSFGSIADKINEAINSGIFVSIATGNDGYTNGISYPACVLNATAVGGVNGGDIISFNRGDLLDVLAPGVGIMSSVIGGGYSSMSGTSMSTPHVAGAAILLRQYARLQGYNLTPEEITNTLRNTGKNITDGANVYPRIDVLKAIYSLDIVDPVVILDSPINKIYDKSNISLEYTAEDVNLDTVWYELENVNTTLNGNTSLNLSNGNYNLKIYVNDSNGNLNSDNIDFKIRANDLIVNLDSPVDNYEDEDGNVTLDCNASDIYDLMNVSLYTDLSGNFSLEQTNNVSGLINSTSFDLNDIADDTDFIWGCKAVNNNSQNLFSYNRTLKIRINDAPVFVGYINNQTWDEDNSLVIDLDGNFTDADGDSLVYSSTSVTNINVSFAGSVVTLTPDADWFGNAQVKFNVSDGLEIAESNLVDLTVNSMPDCGDNSCDSSESCSSCQEDCGSCSPSTPSGGGGGDWSPAEETAEAKEETGATASEVVEEEPVEAGPEITGSAVKEVEDEGFWKVLWIKIKKGFWRVVDFFKNIKFK